MASKGSKVDGDGGGRNKTLAIVAVVVLGAAGAYLYFGRGPNLEETVKEQVAQQQAAHPAPPAAPADESGVAVPEDKKTEATADAGSESSEEAPADGTPVKKKPIQAKSGRSIK